MAPKKGAVVPAQGPSATPGSAQVTRGVPLGSKHSDKAAGKAACTAVPRQSIVPDLFQLEAVRFTGSVVLLERLAPLSGFRAQEPLGSMPLGAQYDARRTLSFQEESGLARTLAFLSGVSDDNNHVTAVCLEELPDEQGLKVLVAINRLTPESSSDVLNKIHAGFKKIFEQLAGIVSTSSKKSKAATTQAVFNTIVALCRDRILSRLGLPASREGKKRFIGLNLEEFLGTQWKREAKKNLRHPGTELENYRLQTKALLGRLYDLNTAIAPKHDDVVELVGHIVRYMASVPLKSLLDCVKNQDMPPNSRERIFICFSKVARYWESAKYLCRRAKTSDTLRRTTVEQVQLQENSFRMPPTAAFTGSVKSVLTNLSKGGTTLGINSLPCWERKAIQSAPTSHFAKQVNKRLQESKVHAEIQIVAHYEQMSPGVLRPRVIASCKDACYLCDTLILQGKYSVPKSHGKLYPGWRLPADEKFLPLQQELNAFLEREILATIKKLSRLATKPSIKPPNESTIFPLHISASTLMTFSNTSSLHLAPQVETSHDSTAHQEHIGTCISGPQHAESPHEQPVGIHQSEEDTTDPHVSVDGLIGTAKERDETETSHAASVDDSHSHSRSTINNSEYYTEKSQGGCPAPSDTVEGKHSWFRHGNMEIFLESSSPEFVPKWLSPVASANILRDRSDPITDVLLLAAGADDRALPKSPDGNTYFAFGERVVMINTS